MGFQRLVMMLLVVSLASCSAATASTVMPVLERALALATEAAKRHGKDLSKAPVTCEHEYDPQTKKLYMLCEADLSVQVD